MICPHCGKEHPDDFKVCPYTAKPIETQLQYCKNEGCNFRSPLPLSAKFCPNCGKPLKPSVVVDTPIATSFCCMIETAEGEYSEDGGFKLVLAPGESLADLKFQVVPTRKKKLNKSEDSKYRKFKIVSATGESLSEFDFHIVAETKKELNNSDYIHQMLLFETQNNHLYYLDAKGILTKIGSYGDEDGYREGKSYWDNKWRYDANIMDENHILFRNGTTYSLYCIGSDGVPMLINRFSTKLHNLCQEKLIGDYICTDKASIRVSDGYYETIQEYKRCRCIGYLNERPIFAASKESDWTIDDMRNGCDIVSIDGHVLWYSPKNVTEIEVFSDKYIICSEGSGRNDKSALFTLDGKNVIKFEDYWFSPTKNKDVIELDDTYFSLLLNKECVDYEACGEYYKLVEKVHGGYIAHIISNKDSVEVYSIKAGDEDGICGILDSWSNEYFPLLLNYKGEIVNLHSGKVIHYFDEDEDDCIGISLLASRIAINTSSAIEIIDFDGNILNRIVEEDGWERAVMCSNGYLLLYNFETYEIKYYDIDFNENLLKLPQLNYNSPQSLWAGDMFQDNIITLCDGGRDTCVILTTSGDIVYDGCGLKFVTSKILKNYDTVVNMEKLIIIRNCKEIII